MAGGYPAAGGVGGKRQYASIMAAGLGNAGHRAYVGGTLAANPLSALAGYTAIKEIERTNACEIAGRAGDRLADGLKMLLDKYGLPYVAYNQGSIVHLECTGAMSFDFFLLLFRQIGSGTFGPQEDDVRKKGFHGENGSRLYGKRHRDPGRKQALHVSGRYRRSYRRGTEQIRKRVQTRCEDGEVQAVREAPYGENISYHMTLEPVQTKRY